MVAIIDYEAGNLTSVALAVRHLGFVGEVTQDPAVIASAERVIFPGQGAAGSAMANLRRLGLDQPLRAAIADGRPVLGICIAHQLIFDHTAEDGGVACLGLLPGPVIRFDFAGRRVKIPQMGWNAVELQTAHPVFEGFESGWECYFVHSYYPVPADPALTLASTEYEGLSFASIVGRDNLISTQFHPEKSGRAGLTLLRNFLTWDGRPC
ncbi:MAG: imidazole glycerol phosphate synthase subunit HisH [Fimbriimonadaceae bacterium]|nr:imidazole glycerol phosphate synthase subunit HisH [Fimbriimonadaceae bacterium]